MFKSNQPWVNSKQVTIEQAEETKHLFQIILNSKRNIFLDIFHEIKLLVWGQII